MRTEGLSSFFSRAYDTLTLSWKPFYFGFTPGHFDLSEEQIGLLEEVLYERLDADSILDHYETSFASLIGDGKGISFAAARMAFFALMKALQIGEGDELLLTGFTCAVMANAVLRTKAVPVFADIELDTFGPDPDSIESRISSKTKLIVVQHSFGIPCQIDRIMEMARANNIFVLEDCALTLDASLQGQKVGSWGDAALFSTDHSKPLNTLVGGLLYVRNEALFRKLKRLWTESADLDQKHQSRLFARLLYERQTSSPASYSRRVLGDRIRGLWELVSGNKVSPFLGSDFSACENHDDYPYPAKMPPFLAQVGLLELGGWQAKKARRTQILQSYLKRVENTALHSCLPKAYVSSDRDISPLRFVCLVPPGIDLQERMCPFFDVSWIWFRKPLAGVRGPLESLGYRWGDCPNAEMAGRRIVNWPCVVSEEWEDRLLEAFSIVIEIAGEKYG